MTATHPELPADGEPRDELVAEILARRRRRTPLLTLILVLLVAAGAAFAGGVEAQRHWGSSSSSTAASGRGSFAALASRFGAARLGTAVPKGAGGLPRFFRGGGGAAFGGAATTGTVTLIRGSTLYVTDATGNTVLVHTSPSSTVTKTVSGSVRTILPGQTVTVVGTQAKNGSYTARSISIAPSRGSNGSGISNG